MTASAFQLFLISSFHGPGPDSYAGSIGASSLGWKEIFSREGVTAGLH